MDVLSAWSVSSQAVAKWAGCSYRQVDYWCRCGHFGDRLRRPGEGRRRRFDLSDCEALWAVARLADLGADYRAFEAAAILVRGEPVDEAGEVLTVTFTGVAERHPTVTVTPGTAPMFVVPLRPARTKTAAS